MDHKVCVVCNGPHHEEKLLLCDKCDEGYHTFCLDPPLKKIPSGDWFCPGCAKDKERSVKAKPTKAKSTTKSTANKKAVKANGASRGSKRAAKKESDDDAASEPSEGAEEDEDEDEEEEAQKPSGKNKKTPVMKKKMKKNGKKVKKEKAEDSDEEGEEEEEEEDKDEDGADDNEETSRKEKKASAAKQKSKARSKQPAKTEEDDDDAMQEEEQEESEEEQRASTKMKKEKKEKEKRSTGKTAKRSRGKKEEEEEEEEEAVADKDKKKRKEKKRRRTEESDEGEEGREEEAEEEEEEEEEASDDDDDSAEEEDRDVKKKKKKKKKTASSKREVGKRQSRRVSTRTRNIKEQTATKKKTQAPAKKESGKKRKKSPPPPSARDRRKLERDKRKKQVRKGESESEQSQEEEEEEDSDGSSEEQAEDDEDESVEEEEKKKKKAKKTSKREKSKGSRTRQRRSSRQSVDTQEDDGDWEAQESEDEEEDEEVDQAASGSDDDEETSKRHSRSSPTSSKSNSRKQSTAPKKGKEKIKKDEEDDAKDEEKNENEDEDAAKNDGETSRKRKRQAVAATSNGESISKRRASGVGTGEAPRRLNKSLRRSERNRKRRERQERRARGEVSEDEEEEESDDEEDEMLQNLKCECCGRGDDGNKLLLCDGEGCNKGYHIFCIFPPLDEIPEDDWFCDQCELIRNNPFPTLPEGALTGTSDENVLGSPTPQGADQQGTPTMQDWMENMSFTVKPAPSDHDEANRQSLDFKLRNDEMALDFAKAGTPTTSGRKSPNSLNDFDSSNFNATNSLASRTSTRIDDTKTVILWRGGLTFDGANMGDFTISFRGVPAHADECKKIVREWGDRVSLLAGKKGTALPLTSTDSHGVTVLPGSNKAAYDRFAAQLEENNWVCTISYPRSDLCIYPSTMRPPSDGSAASSRLSGMLIPKTKAAAAAVAGVGTTAAQKIAAPPGSGSPRMQAEVAFMTGIRYALLGYPPANLSLPPGPASNPEQRRVNSVVPYLARPGGAHYVSEKDLTHANTDLIVVHPNHLHRLASLVPGMLECRLNPAIVFVRGIEYLENCCKRQALLTPHPSDVIYPSGGIIVLLADDILSGTTILVNVLAMIGQESKERREWIVKIQPEDIMRLKEMKNTSPLASSALQLMQQRPETFSSFADNETSQSRSVDIPSVVRSALKLSLVHIAKYRHVVLITENKALQGVAKGQNLLCMSMEDLRGFFAEQAKLRMQPRHLKPSGEVAPPSIITPAQSGPGSAPQSGYQGPRAPGILPLPVSASPLLAGLGGSLNASPQLPSAPQFHPFLPQQQHQQQQQHQHQQQQQHRQQQGYSPSLSSLAASSAMKNGGGGGGSFGPQGNGGHQATSTLASAPPFGRKPP